MTNTQFAPADSAAQTQLALDRMNAVLKEAGVPFELLSPDQLGNAEPALLARVTGLPNLHLSTLPGAAGILDALSLETLPPMTR